MGLRMQLQLSPCVPAIRRRRLKRRSLRAVPGNENDDMSRVLVQCIVAGLLTCGPECVACFGQEGKTQPMTGKSSPTDVEKKYAEAFRAWKKFIQSPGVQESSRTSDYTSNPAFDKVVALGKDALPLIMTDIEKGE